MDPGYLDLPFLEDRPRIWRFESGIVLDPLLRKLARLSGAVDRSLALHLSRLKAKNGSLQLGYATLNTYVQERLNLKLRTTREFVRLGGQLERMPVLDDAFRHGRLTWTSAAQVARLVKEIADEEEERQWVGMAERLSVRELTAAVTQELKRNRGARSSDMSSGKPGDDGSTGSGADGNAAEFTGEQTPADESANTPPTDAASGVESDVVPARRVVCSRRGGPVVARGPQERVSGRQRGGRAATIDQAR